MDKIQQNFKIKYYLVKGIYSKNKKMNIKCLLMKQIIGFLALLALNTIIFLFYSQRKIENNFKKIYKRKLEDYMDSSVSDSDTDTDTDTDIDTEYDTAPNTTFYTI